MKFEEILERYGVVSKIVTLRGRVCIYLYESNGEEWDKLCGDITKIDKMKEVLLKRVTLNRKRI